MADHDLGAVAPLAIGAVRQQSGDMYPTDCGTADRNYAGFAFVRQSKGRDHRGRILVTTCWQEAKRRGQWTGDAALLPQISFRDRSAWLAL
jgi:hypothetical protein